MERRDINACFFTVAAPGAPRDLTVTWSNATSVRLQWAPPRQTNGRIDFYQLQYYHSSPASYIGLLAGAMLSTKLPLVSAFLSRFIYLYVILCTYMFAIFIGKFLSLYRMAMMSLIGLSLVGCTVDGCHVNISTLL